MEALKTTLYALVGFGLMYVAAFVWIAGLGLIVMFVFTFIGLRKFFESLH